MQVVPSSFEIGMGMQKVYMVRVKVMFPSLIYRIGHAIVLTVEATMVSMFRAHNVIPV
jgi:hypothetical protein